MPQESYTDDWQSLKPINGCKLIFKIGCDVGAGMVKSHIFTDYTEVYSYETYAGSAIGTAWCPNSESKFGRLMAYGAAVRWDEENAL